MAYVNGKIIFSELKGFPVLDDNAQVETDAFINGASEIVSLIGKWTLKFKNVAVFQIFISDAFGALFMPVVRDMGGNVEVKKKL